MGNLSWEQILNNAIVFSSRLNSYDPNIFFCYNTFKWNNEAKNSADVYCIILGLNCSFFKRKKLIFDVNGEDHKITKKLAKNINWYLIDAENIIVKYRSKPLENSYLPINYGSMPIDENILPITEEEYKKIN